MKKAIVASILLLSLCELVRAQGLEEIVVTGGRSDGAPVVISVKGDYHIQPIQLINDSLVAEERVRDVEAAYIKLIEESLNSSTIAVATGADDLKPISSSSDFKKRYSDNAALNKGYVNLVLKSEIKKHNSAGASYSEKYLAFLEGLGSFGRSKILFSDESDITILNPRQYRGQLIKAIGTDIKRLTESLGGNYGAIMTGLDSEVKWHREGEDNVEFYIPYEFVIVPKNINTIQGEY